MDIIALRDYILSLPNMEETQPFEDKGIIVYKIGGKWCAVFHCDNPAFIGVKCDPDRAIVLRDKYEAITPAWHFNKKYWNYLRFEALPDAIVQRELRHSYLTVIRKNVTPKALRVALQLAAEEAHIDDAPMLE